MSEVGNRRQAARELKASARKWLAYCWTSDPEFIIDREMKAGRGQSQGGKTSISTVGLLEKIKWKNRSM